MKKVAKVVGLLVVLFLGGFLGQTLDGNATSKVELEELVQKQQTTIDNLTFQLADVTKRLESLESKESNTEEIEPRLTRIESIIGEWDTEMSVIQYLNDLDNRFNKRVLTLEKIHRLDYGSIQEDIKNLPQHISNVISGNIYYHSSTCGGSYSNNCTYPIAMESLNVYGSTIGSIQYNIFDYITEEKIKEIALNAYNQFESDKVIYQNIKIHVQQPNGQPNTIIEISLQ
jgi:hypothetical protein